jgi:hypothetical protein
MSSERHVVGPNAPADHDGREGIEDHERGVDGPFCLDETTVNDDKTGNTLESNDSGGS